MLGLFKTKLFTCFFTSPTYFFFQFIFILLVREIYFDVYIILCLDELEGLCANLHTLQYKVFLSLCALFFECVHSRVDFSDLPPVGFSWSSQVNTCKLSRPLPHFSKVRSDFSYSYQKVKHSKLMMMANFLQTRTFGKVAGQFLHVHWWL